MPPIYKVQDPVLILFSIKENNIYLLVTIIRSRALLRLWAVGPYKSKSNVICFV